MPSWLSWWDVGLLISGLWFQTPHWVWQLLKNKILKKIKINKRSFFESCMIIESFLGYCLYLLFSYSLMSFPKTSCHFAFLPLKNQSITYLNKQAKCTKVMSPTSKSLGRFACKPHRKKLRILWVSQLFLTLGMPYLLGPTSSVPQWDLGERGLTWTWISCCLLCSESSSPLPRPRNLVSCASFHKTVTA